MGKPFLALLFIGFFCATRIGNLVCASRVELVNNGYVNLVVAITPSTPRSQSETIIGNIKKMILSASPVLYKATESRAYFQKVHILIPDSWNHIEANLSTWETFEKADVIIDTPNPMHGDVPYTRQNGQCGDPGEKIHLTPNYVATLDQMDNNRQHGKPGKVFVHEWAHYRYGVFDEYGQPGNMEFPLFYYKSQDSFTPSPNICADKPPIYSLLDISNNATACQIDPMTNNYDENCRFVFDESFQPETSLASYHLLDSVEHFCRDDQTRSHDYGAPHKHNAMCNKASVFTVVMRSADFNSNLNSRVDLSKFTTEFHIVRPSGPRFVLVADVSLSMKDHDRIIKLGEAARAWIKNDLPTGSKLGMVQFSAEATVISELKVITDEGSRQMMMDQVPSQLDAATCIGCGLKLAVNMLQGLGETGAEKGGIIVLVTDGKNSPGYLDTSDLQPKILEAGIRVITIALGREADESIENLADITDGKAYFVNDLDASETLHEAFMGALTYQSSISNGDLQFKLYEKHISLDEIGVLEAEFNVDPTLGRNLKLSVFNLESRDSVLAMVLVGPEDQAADTDIDFDTTTASVKVDLAKAGQWNFVIEFEKTEQTKDIVITVTTQLLEDAETVISTRCWVPNGANIEDANANPVRILAEVWKGAHPVTGATVRAFVTKPDDMVEILDLYDNGANADTTADDGVYSRYFSNPTLAGRYSVKCQIISNETALEKLGFIGSASPQLDWVDQNEQKRVNNDRIPAGNFTRIVSGGSFQVEVPVSKYDAYPPGDVRDLSVSLVDQTTTNVSIELKWTAPGDEIDWGFVSYYELKYSDDAFDLLDNNFDNAAPLVRGDRSSITEENLLVGSLDPTEAGALQSATFLLNDIQKEKPYYVALRAFDKANKCSRVSNLAVFFIPNKSALVLIMDPEDSRRLKDSIEDEAELINKSANFHTSSLLMAIGGLLLIVGLCALLLLAVVKHTARRRTSYAAVPDKVPEV